MRGLDRGESFVVTRNGAPVGELLPLRRRQFVPAEVALAAFKGVGRIDYERFRADVDRVLDQGMIEVVAVAPSEEDSEQPKAVAHAAHEVE